jgi:hypothetical protein
MEEVGHCPTCGRVIVAEAPPASGTGDDATAAAPTTPWHFKLLLVALVIYLGYRAFQGIAWLVAHA